MKTDDDFLDDLGLTEEDIIRATENPDGIIGWFWVWVAIVVIVALFVAMVAFHLITTSPIKFF